MLFFIGIIVASIDSDFMSQGYSHYEAKRMRAEKLGFLFPIYLLCGLIYYLYWKIKVNKK